MLNPIKSFLYENISCKGLFYIHALSKLIIEHIILKSKNHTFKKRWVGGGGGDNKKIHIILVFRKLIENVNSTIINNLLYSKKY